MTYESMGKLIQTRRKELGLTQKDLAEKLNITDKAVSKWEKGYCLSGYGHDSPISGNIGRAYGRIAHSQDDRKRGTANCATSFGRRNLLRRSCRQRISL